MSAPLIRRNNIFPTFSAAENYYRGYRPGAFTSRMHGGQVNNEKALREFVEYKIANGEIVVTNKNYLY